MGIGSSHKLVGCLSSTRTCAMSESVYMYICIQAVYSVDIWFLWKKLITSIGGSGDWNLVPFNEVPMALPMYKMPI